MQKQCKTRAFIQALLLALLLHLSGHTFLHLTDTTVEGGETHIVAHEEPRGFSASPHQCSICQDHQQLALDVPATATIPVAVCSSLALPRTATVVVISPRQHVADRAPPRS